jgi:hypothetical protein
MPAHRAKGATKALLYAAPGASAWRALSALSRTRERTATRHMASAITMQCAVAFPTLASDPYLQGAL